LIKIKIKINLLEKIKKNLILKEINLKIVMGSILKKTNLICLLIKAIHPDFLNGKMVAIAKVLIQLLTTLSSLTIWVHSLILEISK